MSQWGSEKNLHHIVRQPTRHLENPVTLRQMCNIILGEFIERVHAPEKNEATREEHQEPVTR